VITSLGNEKIYYSYRLEFECTNNIAEYEALIIGMELAIEKKVKNLHVRGDSDLIVSQVTHKCATKNPRLKDYKIRALESINHFDQFSIEVRS
jgi:ribonuclease HI